MRSAFAICILTRTLLAIVIAVLHSHPKINVLAKVVSVLIAINFFILRVFNLRLHAAESSTKITYWHEARSFHAATYAATAILLSSNKTSRFAFIPLIGDVLVGICIYYTWGAA